MGVGPGMFGTEQDWKWLVRFVCLCVFVLVPLSIWKLLELLIWLYSNVSISVGVK